MMRTRVIPAVLASAAALFVAAVGTPAARADTVTYDFDFTATVQINVSGLPAGSFGYDAGTHLFSNFLVSMDGNTYDLTASANAPDTGLTPDGFSPGGLTGGAYTYAYLTSGAAEWDYEYNDDNFGDVEVLTRSFNFGGPAVPYTGFLPVAYDASYTASPYDLSRGALSESRIARGNFTLSVAPAAAAPLPSAAGGTATLLLALLAARSRRRRHA